MWRPFVVDVHHPLPIRKPNIFLPQQCSYTLLRPSASMTSCKTQFPLLHIDLNQKFLAQQDELQFSLSPFTFTPLSSSSPSSCPISNKDLKARNDYDFSESNVKAQFRGVTDPEQAKIAFAVDWTSPEVRLAKKTARSSLKEQRVSCSSTSDETIRVCSDCSTTKTPLWRSGPRGPKTLCNACGIRQRKAHRAMAEAAGGPLPPKKAISERNENRQSNVNHVSMKRKKLNDFRPNNGNLECDIIPQDERDAAILLMALSYGIL